MQRRPKETPPAKADIKDESQKQVDAIESTGNTLAWCLDGPTLDIQGQEQPILEDTQGNRR
jgi:hypothetical protein